MLAEDMGYKANGEGVNNGKGRSDGRGVGDDDGGDEEESNTFYEAVSEPDLCLETLKITNDATSVNKITTSALDEEEDSEEVEGARCLPQVTDVIETESASALVADTSIVIRAANSVVDTSCILLDDQMREDVGSKRPNFEDEDDAERPKQNKSKCAMVPSNYWIVNFR